MPPLARVGVLLTLVLWASRPFAACAASDDSLYTDEQADCAARLIFLNECSGRDENLLFWSRDEAFPSLGIGHFIWYPRATLGPYQESFPGYLAFAAERGLAVPEWVAALPDGGAPWKDREEFERDRGSPRARELHAFLRDTKREQAHYIMRRFRRIFPSILGDLDESDRRSVQAKYELLMASRQGTFAMVDYVNFKGEGFRTDARYDGSGWGLAQVLLEMRVPDDPSQALEEFILAAERVLERRVSRAPRPDVESRWLVGWKNRLRGYRKVECP